VTTVLDEGLVAAAITAAPSAIPAQHGLLSVATGLDRWRWQTDGIQFPLEGCEYIHANPAEFCPPGIPEDLVPAVCPGYAVFRPPVALEILVERSTLPGDRPADIAARLRLGLSNALERAIWVTDTRDSGLSHRLIGGGPADVPGPTDITGKSIGDLITSIEDEFLKTMSGAGTLHMAPSAAGRAFQEHLIEEQDGVLRTKTIGSKIVIGNYARSVVVGHIGNVYADVSEVEVQKGYDHTKNVVLWRATALGLAAWNTCGWWKGTIA
jgi:hypothetical protein